MPRTGRYNPPRLELQVDDLQATYLPGATLTGTIKYANPNGKDQPWPEVPMRLKFFGRAKTKYIVKTSSGKSITRGRAVFFELYQSQLAFSEDVTGSRVYPFSITIPETPAAGIAQRSDEWKPHSDQYLTTINVQKQPVDVTKHPLPSVMYYHGASSMSGKTSEAYVEYILLAEAGTKKATLPIFLREKGTDLPITDFQTRMRAVLQLTKTPSLLAEHPGNELTFRQKSLRFFRPSKTPKYSYYVKVEHPRILQLEHPEPLPLRISILPNWKDTTIDVNSLPSVNLTSISLKLKMQIDIRCSGTFWDSDNDKHHDFVIPFQGTLKPFPIPIVLASDLEQITTVPELHGHLPPPILRTAASTPNFGLPSLNYSDSGTDVTHISENGIMDVTSHSDQASSTALHLGERYSIHLGCSACSTLNKPPVSFKRQIYPTFTTYNIKLHYQLKWKFGIECAGEVSQVSGTAPVTILAPSEQQEAQKVREMGTEGMKKNYDDLEHWAGVGIQLLGGVLSAVS